MLSENYSLEYISNLELESINNFVIKESFEIVSEEVEYFFDSKEHLIDIFVEGIDFANLSPKYLQERFCKVLLSQKELENFLLRLEKRVKRELSRSPIKIDFSLSDKLDKIFNMEKSFSFIYESARTLSLSCFTEKAVDLVWKKSNQGFIPKGLKKFTMQFKAGEYFLSNVGLSQREIKCSINNKIVKSVHGILKQNKIQLINMLNNEIILNLFDYHRSVYSLYIKYICNYGA
jgi:hypothetical protein